MKTGFFGYQTVFPRLLVWLCLAVLFIGLPLIFVPASHYSFEPPKVFLLRLGVVFLGSIAALNITSQSWRRFTIKWRQSILLPLAFAYGIVLLTAALTSTNLQLSLWGTALDHHGTLTTLCCIFVGLVLIWIVQSNWQGQRLLQWLVVGSVPVCLYGLVQLAGFDPLPWETDSVSPLLSTLGRSNFVAAYLAILLPLTLFLAQRNGWRQSWPLWLILLLQSSTLLATQARAGWLAGIVGIIVPLLGQIVLQHQPNRRPFARAVQTVGAICLVGIMGVAGFQQWRQMSLTAPAPVSGDYETLRIISVERRFLIWQETWQLVPQAGWLGYGPEQFLPLFEQQVDVPALFDGVNTTVNDPHNILLDQLISVGFLGTAVFILIIGAFYRLGLRRRDRFAWAMLGSMSAFLVQAMFTPDIVLTTLLFWVLIGLMGASAHWPQATAVPYPTLDWQRPRLSMARLAAFFTGKHLVLFLLGAGVVSVGLFWRGYHLTDWLRFTGDEARDLFAALQIVQGKSFPTHGPKVHIGFGYLGPAYYYLLALPLWLTNGAPAAAGWLSVLVDCAAIGMVYLVGKRLFNATTGWIAALLYAFSFQIIFYARWGWHPSLMPFFTLLVIYGCLRLAEGEQRWFPTVMLALSLALQLHLTAVLLIVPISLVVWAQRKQITLPLFGFALVVGLYPFVPLILFEVSQGYPNLQGIRSLAAFQESEVWTSPIGYLLNSLGTISTGDIIHKSVELVGNRHLFTVFNLGLTLSSIALLWRQPLPRRTRWIFASWAVVPPLAMAVYSGFRPDYYLISWFAVPLLLVANLIQRLWESGRFRLLAPLLLLLILGLNANTLSAYYSFMADRDHTYAHFYGTPLAQKEAILSQIADAAGDAPYELRFVTWAWPNHQPYAYLLMTAENKPTSLWLHEPLMDDPTRYHEHWLDTSGYFATSGKTPQNIYIVTEPDSLPLPDAWRGAEKIGSFGGSGIYQMVVP